MAEEHVQEQRRFRVEVAGGLLAAVAVRDSKDPDGPKLAFSLDAWRRFAGRLRSGAR
ncbi:MAG TPA: DUF397 domain-containing protein [Streptosporangiaceae bacterium]|nr:DUF397 domain-containing protein [Streptosporangiaceae bacterium]